jgi:hypothetical protein
MLIFDASITRPSRRLGVNIPKSRLQGQLTVIGPAARLFGRSCFSGRG